MERTEVAIVGAGAAGLAASRQLREMGVPHVLLEAKPTIGGRTICDEASFGFAYDLGGFWLSDDGCNFLVRAASELGFDISNHMFPGAEMPMILGSIWETHAQKAERLAFNEQVFEAIRGFDPAMQDRSVADLCDRTNPWSPVLRTWMEMLHNRRLESISAIDQTRLKHGTYLQVREGMGSLIRSWGREELARVNHPVERLDFNQSGVELHSPHGSIVAKAAIVTVSTGVLASGKLAFGRVLPDRIRIALEHLPMGNVNRIAVQFDDDVFGDACPPCFGRFVSPGDYIYVMTRLVGQQVALGYVGSDLADELEAQPDAVAVDLLCDALKPAIGADVRSRIVRVVCTRWRSDPWTLGAYAMAVPGGADARQVLREPVDGRLYFAGEATSPTQFAHVHGAANEGMRAARSVAASL